jgi:RNA-directed DNA polymerase
MSKSLLVTQLARSFLAGEPTVEQIVVRCSQTLGMRWHWLPSLARRYTKKFAGGTRPRRHEVVEFLRRDRVFRHAWSKYGKQLHVAGWLNQQQTMQPVRAAKNWDIPVIESIAALANWLNVSIEELEWFADLKGLTHRNGNPQLSHYNYRVLIKDSGNVRLIESPKSRLKKLQQQVLSSILDKVPSHPAVHGFVNGRSVRTCVSVHAGQHVILRMDLKDFFPSFPARRIQAMFRTLGYPEPVADLLGGICTNFTPVGVWSKEQFSSPLGLQGRQWARDLYCRPHLPQGAPTSPSFANICSYRLDCRLSGLAKSAGAAYTRYADDLAFSGGAEFERTVERFSLHAAAICLQEGFHVNHRKTRIMRQGVRQHLVGLVANSHPNIIRADFDRLKAILTNCVRLGPDSQNREGHPQFRMHLEGRVAFARSINPGKSERLRRLFEQIRWE